MLDSSVRILAGLGLVTFLVAPLTAPALDCVDYETTVQPIIWSNLDNEFGTMTVVGNQAVAINQDRSFQVWDVSDLTEPLLLGEIPLRIEPPILLAVYDHRAYVSTRNKFICIDFANPFQPRIVGTMPVEGRIGIISCLNPTEDYVYGVVARSDPWFLTIDIRDPANMVIAGETRLPAIGHRMAITGHHAFVAADENGLYVLDIADRANPTVVYTDPTLRYIEDVIILNNRAYGPGTFELFVLDISQPEAPVTLDIVETPHDSHRLVENEDHQLIAIGRSRLQIFDLADPDSPRLLGAAACHGWNFAGFHGDQPLGWRGDCLVSYDLTRPTVSLIAMDIPYVVASTALNDHVVVWCGRERLFTVDVSDAYNPAILGETEIDGLPDALVVIDDFAFVASNSGWLEIYDLSDPALPSLDGSFNLEGVGFIGHNGMAAGDDLIYLLGSETGLDILDTSDPTDPKRLGHFDVPGSSWLAVAARPGLACVSSAEGTLYTLDVSDPEAPQILGHLVLADPDPGAIAFANDWVYVGHHGNGLQIVDVGRPESPTVIGAWGDGGDLYDIAVAGRFVYLASGESGLHVIDCQDPTAPRPMGCLPSVRMTWDVTLMPNLVVFAAEYLQIAPLQCEGTVGVDDWQPTSGPRGLTAAPNPFNPRTVLRLEGPIDGSCELAIFDLRGRRVRTLHDGVRPTARSSIAWDGRDDRGSQLPSGVYMAQLRHTDGLETIKLLLQK